MTPQNPTIDPEAKKELIDTATEHLSRQPRTLRDLIQGPEFKVALKAVLPRTITPERFVRVTLTAMLRVPALADCSKESVFRCLLDLSAFGLEPDGRRAHLIPFKNNKMCQCGHEMDAHKAQQCSKCDCGQRRTLVECTLVIDYKGLAELVRRSGDVSYIHADVVYDKDEWSFSYGTDAHLKHKIGVDRGTKKIAYYSFVKLKDGSEDFIVLTPAEVEKVRQRSKSPDAGPWKTDYDEMGKKTAFRRHSKWLPLSPEVREAVERDDDAVDISGWHELMSPDATAPKRLTARDTIMNTPSFAPDAGADPAGNPLSGSDLQADKPTTKQE